MDRSKIDGTLLRLWLAGQQRVYMNGITTLSKEFIDGYNQALDDVDDYVAKRARKPFRKWLESKVESNDEGFMTWRQMLEEYDRREHD